MNVGHLFLLSGVVLVAACCYAGSPPRPRPGTSHRYRPPTGGGDVGCTPPAVTVKEPSPLPECLARPVAVFPAALMDRDSGLWVPTLEVRHETGGGGAVRDCDVTSIDGEPRLTFAAALADAHLMAHGYRATMTRETSR